MDKPAVLYPYNGILPCNKEEWNTDTSHTSIDESQMHEWVHQTERLHIVWLYLYDIIEKMEL